MPGGPYTRVGQDPVQTREGKTGALYGERGSLYNEVSCIMGIGHMGHPVGRHD